MVTVDGPATAEPVVANVKRQVVGDVPALKEPLTPVGRPAMVNVTVLAKPFCGFKVKMLVPAAPCAMLSVEGEAESVNVGGAVMVSAIVALLVSVPDVPVMVTVETPVATVPAAANVTLRGAALAGPKVAVTPAGSPELASATVPLKPFRAVMAMLLATLAPGLTLTLAGVAEIVKLGGATMVSAMVVLLTAVPDVPLMVTVETPAAAELAAVKVNVL
jgi:hypothetical protein